MLAFLGIDLHLVVALSYHDFFFLQGSVIFISQLLSHCTVIINITFSILFISEQIDAKLMKQIHITCNVLTLDSPDECI